MELDATAQPPLEQIERFQGSDLVVGILGAGGNGRPAHAAAMVREALDKLAHPPRTVLVMDDGAGGSHVEEELPVPVLICRLAEPGVLDFSPQTTIAAYQTILGLSGKIGARACGVVASNLETVTPQWIDRLVRPVLEMDLDLVAPRYARRKSEGLLNRSILSPFSRALYGKRVQNPVGPDFGLSGRLMHSILEDHAMARRVNPGHPLASLVSTAVRGGFQICETELGARHFSPPDSINLSSLLAQILGAVFLDMEWNAALWQRVRGSQAVPVQGDPEPASEESGGVDVHRQIESFQLGAKNLMDVWSLVLPPTTLLELHKIARAPFEQFRMPDELWVGIVYDFALAHRIRTINRDHLLRSFTPLYLGWIASYSLDMEVANPAAVQARLERLARAYEAGKPYLVSRWRWPDRFNP